MVHEMDDQWDVPLVDMREVEAAVLKEVRAVAQSVEQ